MERQLIEQTDTDKGGEREGRERRGETRVRGKGRKERRKNSGKGNSPSAGRGCRWGQGPLGHQLITASEDKMDFVNALWKLVLGPRDINLDIEMIYPDSTPRSAL